MEIVGVRFNDDGKVYYFNSNGLSLKLNLTVIVNTEKGIRFGKIVDIKENDNVDSLFNIIRIASKKDFQQHLKNIQDEKVALAKCRELVTKEGLKMTVIDATYNFDKSQLVFRFLADERIDFRKLAKDLGSILKTRIELRQIGVRDEVKRIGGNGVCGRELCCCSFLSDFETVSIKMAKEQNISLNPSKISGNCGRLMCCLKYEQEVYEDKLQRLPNIGAIVKTPDGQGEVEGIEPLKEIVKVKIKDGEIYKFKRYEAKEIKIIKDIAKEHTDNEEKEYQKELKELENLEKNDLKLKEN